MNLLSYFTKEWNSLTRGAGMPVTVHFRVGLELWAAWNAAMVAMTRDVAESPIPATSTIAFKSGTIRPDPFLGPWGWTYIIERTVPLDSRLT